MIEEKNIPTVYDPKQVEEKWYSYWLKENLFRAEVNPDKEPFTIVIPPPNVTSNLHIGHALNNTIQDIFIRWRRMQGYEALWLPGTDHAGIATQAKVVESLAKEGLSRYDLGREKFLERTWAWKEKYGGTIISQLKKMGCSCDWSRERFTMDEQCSQAVKEVFVRLYEQGLIYRGNYMINWCPECRTTLSDIEVEHEERTDSLWYIRYPQKDGSGYVTVATTRPETMLGDTAVAVHPEDERYKDLVGKTLILPIVNREIPIIADEYVDPAFGTGAVKVTPAHDPNDFEMGLRHNLPSISVVNEQAVMTEEAGPYAGMERYACRQAILADLSAGGFLVKTEELNHSVGHCYRCHTVVEPLVSKQWFVKMKPLAEPAIAAVKDGSVKFVPERFTKIYLNWVENVRDWCISRQLWWGHRIPAWYCQDCGETIVAKEEPASCPKCGSKKLEQDPDVLDTWFSSALWPFSTMGWPEKTADLSYFYPTNLLVTGYDIIYFWVARMVFTALKFTGKRPFEYVFITGLVRDALGRKMSKSLGNGVDPLDVIEQYGADTMRFALVTGTTPGNDTRWQEEKVEATRNFSNKIWNASRFVLMNLGDFTPPAELPANLALADRWILSRFNRTVQEVTERMERFDIGEAARVIYEFLWGEYCDWYIELCKPRLYGTDEGAKNTARHVLWMVLKGTLELLHPYMPFITEEIWQYLPHEGKSIVRTSWPKVNPALFDEQAEQAMGVAMEVIKAIRNLRAEMNVPPGKKAPAILHAANADIEKVLATAEPYIQSLAGVSDLTLEIGSAKPNNAAAAVITGVEIFLPLAGLVDFDKEIARLRKEQDGLVKEVSRIEAKLNNEGFLSKAPAEVVAKERERLADYQGKLSAVKERLAALERQRS